MPTVADLKEFTMRASSLNTSDTTESALVMRFLNDAYGRALALSGSATYDATVTPTSGADVILRAAYTPATSLTQGTVGVRGIYLNSGTGAASGRQLQRVSVGDLLAYRTGMSVTSGTGPTMYAVRANGDIELYPATTGEAFTIEMNNQPLTLVESAPVSGQEITPSALPAFLHYEILANYAISQAFSYRGLSDKSSYFRSLYENGLSELRSWLNEQGGIMGPPVKMKRNRSSIGTQPDMRW